jgi:hypothetical protein
VKGTAVRHAASEDTPGPGGYGAELRRHNEVLHQARSRWLTRRS